MTRVIVIALTVCVLPAQLAGQAAPAIDAGARIRVRTPEVREVIGRVSSITADTLVLQPDGGTTYMFIPLASVTRIDISRGLRSPASSAWRHAMWGALIGAVPAALSLALQHAEVGGGTSVGEAALLGAWTGGLFGGLIGAAYGARRRGEKWDRVR